MLIDVPDVKSAGSIVTVDPETATLASVTEIVCLMTPLSLIKILPVPFWMLSVNVSIKLEEGKTSAALLAGEYIETVGAVVSISTVKSIELVANCPATSTVIFPDELPTGTVAVKPVDVLAVTVVAIPLNLTILLVGVVLKFFPVIVTEVPIVALKGLKELTIGIKSDNGLENTPLLTVPAKSSVSLTAKD